ncbi:OmpA family protein [Fusobacterium sp.]|uniref:autotransporter domain-containing protein n=1 Tax=Fusobacterium sp. TaxID=68766 RepID=UPI0025C69450|nr:OmpA family protein [Fusobacterium sp.]
MRDNIYIEKSLKRYIKSKKIGYSISLLVSFLITGSIMYGQELSSSQLKAKIAENNQRIEEIEKRIMELIKEGDYYAKTLEDNNQYFFPLNIEHRHSRGHQHFAVSKSQGPMYPILPSKPVLKPNVPDEIVSGTPEVPNAPDKIEVPLEEDIIEIGDFNIAVTSPELNINVNKPDVNFDRNYITEINPNYDDIKVPDVNTDEKEFIEINMGQYGGMVNTPEKHYSYDPTYAKNPDIFKVNDVERPTDIILGDIKVNTISFVQGGGGIKKTDPNKNSGFEGQVVENYKNYDTNGKTLDITFRDEEGKDNQQIAYEGLENFTLTTVEGNEVSRDAINNFRKTFYSGREGKEHVGQNAAFISSTMGQDSTINGNYNITYGKASPVPGVFKNSKIFLSVNAAGLGSRGENHYNGYGKVDGGQNEQKSGMNTTAITEFTGVLNLKNDQDKGTLIGIDHEFYDTGIRNYVDENFFTKLEDLQSYSTAKNSGVINLGSENGKDKNLVGITISQKRETSALLKLNNHVTINDGEINVNGEGSLGITYEYGGGAKGIKNGLTLSSDLYVGNINLNSNSSGSYGVRLQNVDYKENQFSDGAKVDFTNRHFYDNTRVFGSVVDNQGDEKENIKDLPVNSIEKVKKIALSGTNNAGFVVAKSLSDGAERYLNKDNPDNITANKDNIRNPDALDEITDKGNLDINTSYIGKFNSDLGKDFKGFDFGKVNPIANIHGLNIEVNGTHSVGFLRYKDYSDNNKNDMIITNNDTGAIKEIDFGKDARSSVLIRSDMYGINVEKNLNIDGDGTIGEQAQTPTSKENSTDKKPEKNIILQATKSTWKKNEKDEKEKSKLSVGHIINSGIMKSSQDNIIGMMANTAKVDEFDKNAEKLDKNYDKTDAEIINRKDIILSGKNVIGMAVLDGNKGFLDNGKVITKTDKLQGTVAENQEIKDYNVSIYNNGNFNIMNSTIETSGKGSIALYNNEGTIELRTDRSIDGKNEITATNGAIGIYSKGGTITSNGNLNVTTDTGIGVYAIVKEESTNEATKDATINLNNATVTVGDKDNNGEAGLVAIGKEKVNPNTKDIKATGNTTINFENSTLDYTGRGFALFTHGDGKIKIKDSTINLDGQAFGMNVEFGATEQDRPITFEGDNNNIHVKSNDVTIFNIVSKDNKFSSDLSNLQDKIGEALGNNKQLLGKITADEGITSYKTATVDGGSLTIDKNIYKSATEEDQKKDIFGYFYFKRFLGQRLNTTVNENIIVDATVTGQDSKDYYNGKATGLEIVSSKNATSVGETSLTLKSGSKIIANRIDVVDGEKLEDKNTVGVFSDYANITMEDGSSIIVEKKDDNNQNDKSFNGVGIFAVNGSNIKVGETNSQATKKAEITVYGDNAVGIYAKAYRSEIKDGEETVLKNEYGEQAKEQGKINIENNGIIDVSNGAGTVGIYANNNNDTKDIGTSNSKVVNNGIIKTGTVKIGKDINETISSTGIHGIKTAISNNGVIEIADGIDGKDGKNYGSVGIKATKDSVVKNIGTIKLGKNAMGVLVDETSKIELDKNSTVTFEKVDSTTKGKVDNEAINKVGVAYNNQEYDKYNSSATIRVHDFNVDATNVTGINTIASRGGRLDITKDSEIKITDNHSVGVIVEGSTDGKRAEVHNNGIINIENSNFGEKKGGISVGMLAINKNGHIYNEGTINLNGDDSVGIYISNKDDNKQNANTIEKIGIININGKNNKGVYVASSKADGKVGRDDLKDINFGEKAETSTGLYIKGSNIYLGERDQSLEKSLGTKDKGNVFIRAINTTMENKGHLTITNNLGSPLDPKTGEVYKNIGILLDEGSTYKGVSLRDGKGILEAKNGVIGIYSKVGDNKTFNELKLIVDSQNEETIGLALKGDKAKNSEVSLTSSYGENYIELKNTDPTKVETLENTTDSSKKAIGIAAKDVKLNVGKLELKYDSSNGIGIYLKDNASITGGEITITGESNLKDDFSIGVYANESSTGSIKSDIEIKKKDSIGIYNNKKGLVYDANKRSFGIKVNAANSIGIYSNEDLEFNTGKLSVKGGENKGDASVGIYIDGKTGEPKKLTIGAGTTLEVNGSGDTGIFAKNTEVTNKSTIKVKGGVGAILKGEGSVFNGNSGSFETNINNDKTETALYLINGAKLGDGIANASFKLKLGKNDVGVYGENTIISGENFTRKDGKNRGTFDISRSNEGATGIVVNKVKREGAEDKRLEVKNLNLILGNGNIGIASLDNDTSIDNVKITSLYPNSTAIYLKNKEGSDKNFTVKNTEINLKNGYGILVANPEKEGKLENNKTLDLTNNKIDIDGTLTADKGKAIGVYLSKNNNLNSRYNTIEIKNGIAIYGEENSNIDLTSTDIILEKDSTGIYNNGGKVTLDETTTIRTLNKGGNGAVFVKNGDIDSSATISGLSNSFYGLFVDSSDKGKASSLENKGSITLIGNDNIAVALKGQGKDNKIENSGNIIISSSDVAVPLIEDSDTDTQEQKNDRNIGIYGENTNITNNGAIIVGGKGIGIASVNKEEGYNLNSTGNITLLGKEGIGVYLEGKGTGATIGDIRGYKGSSGSVGLVLKDYNSKKAINLEKVELNNGSLGIHIENKNKTTKPNPTTTTINIGSLEVGKNPGEKNQSVGVIVDETLKSPEDADKRNTTILNIKDKLSAGINGTTIFNKGGNIEINAIEKLEVGKGSGALIHSSSGKITLDTQVKEDKLTINVVGSNGFVSGNGNIIEGTQNLKDKDLTLAVSEGGTGVVFIDHYEEEIDMNRPYMDIGIDKILVQGEEKNSNNNGKEENVKFTKGVYLHNLGELKEEFKTNIEQVGTHTVGTVVSKTWGDITTNIDLTDKAYHSVGMVISDNGDNLTTIETAKEGKEVISVAGDKNIGLEANNSSLKTVGDIKVGAGTSFKNSYPVGVFAENNTGKQLNYTGVGNLNVDNFGMGVITKNYSIDYTGTIKAGVGTVGIFNENDTYSKDKYIKVNGEISLGSEPLFDEEKSAGIYGKNTDIIFTAKDYGMNILSNKRNTGILSVGEGDITYTGNVNIAGVYKDKDFNKGLSSSKGIFKYGTGNITVNKGDWNIGSNSIGIVANSDVIEKEVSSSKTEGITINNSANMTVGKNSLGIYSVGKNTLTNEGNITVSGADDKDSSVGIYMGNSKEGKENLSVGTNKGTITVDGKNAVGVQAVGNVKFHNKGKIEVKNSGIGVFATKGATIYNDKEGIIDLNGDSKDTHSIGMFAKGEGSSIINDGTINANFGVGMYVEDGAELINNKDGVINVKNGVGIKGNGYLNNYGHITIESGYNGYIKDEEGKENTSVNNIIDIKDDIVNIGSHYVGMGGTIDSKLDMILDNPVIDITTGNGLGFKAPNIKGGIALAPNFALSGNGFSYEVKDFIGENTDINVGTSPLFDSKFEGKDLIVNKVDYKDVMKDYKYETFYNSLDNTLRDGIASDIDAIKNLNSYLESFGQTGDFYQEYARTMSEVRGSIYSNVQSRMFDINRSFDNSFDEMEQSYNLSKDTDKYSVIYTGGDYKSGKVEIPDYKYNIMGLQYMKEFEDVNYDNKYGYTFGFTGSKFKFRDNGRSKENIYSLKGGVHNVKSFNKDLDLLTKLDVGLNYHDMTRKLAFGPVSYKNDSDYYSYYVGLDNKFRKTIFKNYQNEFGAYAGAELEYGRFTNIKENGTLALKVKSNDYYIAKGMAGFSGTGRKYLGNDWTAKITGDVGYSYDFAKYDENKVKLRKSNSGYTSILDEVDSKGKVTGKIGIGFERLNHLGVTLEGEVSRDIARDEDYWRVGLRFNYKFNQEDAVTTLRNVFHLMDNHFDFDKDNLKPREQKIVAAGSKIIDTYNLKGTLRLEGHTDSCGSVEYNQGLSERRAETVKREFIKDIKKSENIKYETQGYSELRPVDTNKTKEGRANNRRVEVKFIEK